MEKNNRNELYSISNQMIDIFIQDIFSKNNTDLNKVKTNISDEQRETLKESVNQLKGQVEKFVYDQNMSKKITENDSINEASASPLRKKFLQNKEEGDMAEDAENTEDE